MTHPAFGSMLHAFSGSNDLAARPVRDRISVSDLVLEAEVGAFGQERGRWQRLRFSVFVEVAPNTASLSDDVDQILSYDVVRQAIHAVLQGDRINLLETMAERIAEQILANPKAERVFLKIEKLDRGPGDLGIEIVRERTHEVARRDTDLSPMIVYFSSQALESPYVARWLDQLASRPVIVVAGFLESTLSKVTAPDVQRRIDLLALEQSAWRLAALDDRCVVVASHTELEWGLCHGQLSLWAPSKMVLDASAERSCPPIIAAPELALWFAQRMSACEIVWLGTKPEVVSDVPIRVCDVTQENLGL